MVEAESEAVAEALLHLVHLGAVIFHRLAGLGGGKLGRRAVLVGGADEHHLMAHRAVEPGEKVGRQLAADQRAQVLDAVDIGQGRGDENPGHGASVVKVAPPLAQAIAEGQRRARCRRLGCP